MLQERESQGREERTLAKMKDMILCICFTSDFQTCIDCLPISYTQDSNVTRYYAHTMGLGELHKNMVSSTLTNLNRFLLSFIWSLILRLSVHYTLLAV